MFWRGGTDLRFRYCSIVWLCISIWLFYVANTTDLAVIFRPAVLSHPDHEMQPQEHRLSQEVLEFLIAHQDWFMLDITPPTTGAGTAGTDGGLDAILSSDEEGDGESWKLVGNTPPSRIMRRRTTTEKHDSKLVPIRFTADPQPFSHFRSTWCPDRRNNKRRTLSSRRGPRKPSAVCWR